MTTLKNPLRIYKLPKAPALVPALRLLGRNLQLGHSRYMACQELRARIAAKRGPLHLYITAMQTPCPEGWYMATTQMMDLPRREDWQFLLGLRKLDALMLDNCLAEDLPGKDAGLLANAARYLKPGATLYIRASLPAQQLALGYWQQPAGFAPLAPLADGVTWETQRLPG